MKKRSGPCWPIPPGPSTPPSIFSKSNGMVPGASSFSKATSSACKIAGWRTYLMAKRSRYWLKIKPESSAICYIIGYTEGRGGREGLFGSLVVAQLEAGKWIYRGRVGSGLTQEELEKLSSRLARLQTKSPPFLPGPQEVRDAHWVRPELRCEVLFQEMTERGHFRAPAFKRLLD